MAKERSLSPLLVVEAAADELEREGLFATFVYSDGAIALGAAKRAAIPIIAKHFAPVAGQGEVRECPKCHRPVGGLSDMRALTIAGKCFRHYAYRDPDAAADCAAAELEYNRQQASPPPADPAPVDAETERLSLEAHRRGDFLTSEQYIGELRDANSRQESPEVVGGCRESSELIAAEQRAADLQARLDGAIRERDEAVRSLDFTRQWYAERIRWLEDFFRGPGRELPITDKFWGIIANGTPDANTPPTYQQLLNVAKYRADAAEQQAATLRERVNEIKEIAEGIGRDPSAVDDAMEEIREALAACEKGGGE